MLDTLTQSYYTEVAQGGVSPVEKDTIDCEYLAYFEPKKLKKKIIKEILCNVLVRTLK